MLDIIQHGDVTLVTLKHGRANAQDTVFCREITQCFEELGKVADTKAIVLTGQGNIFSAGVDLVQLTEGGLEYVHEFLPALSRMFETVFFLPKPVVSAVNGRAGRSCAGENRFH